MWNLLVGVTFLLLVVIAFNMLWKYCAQNDKNQGLYKEEEEKVVLAHQIRPGVMMVRGVRGQQIYTAMEDNEDLRMQMLAQQYSAAGYGSVGPRVQHNAPTAPAPAPAQAPVQMMHVQRPSTAPSLIDLDHIEIHTPPPYSPRSM